MVEAEMRVERAELVKLQQAVAEGRLDKVKELRLVMAAQRASVGQGPLEDGEFYWHPKFRLALRVYNSGRAIWICKYRNKRGFERTHGIGNATVLNTTMAENAARWCSARSRRARTRKARAPSCWRGPRSP
jgi:hypothetical protein